MKPLSQISINVPVGRPDGLNSSCIVLEYLICAQAERYLLGPGIKSIEFLKESQHTGNEEWLFHENLFSTYEIFDCEGAEACRSCWLDCEVFIAVKGIGSQDVDYLLCWESL